MRCVQTPQSNCRFGIASADITPPVGICHRMWGAAKHDQATGVHRPLVATVLWIQALESSDDGDAFQVLVALDHCFLWAEEMQNLISSVSSATDVPPERLAVVFSHTHAAGLMGAERASMPGGDLIAPYLRQIQERVVSLICDARETAVAATMVYGHGHCSLAAHRDLWDEQRQDFVCGYNPEGLADDTVVVARVTDEKGKNLASIVNYACHPTTLAWDNTLISPDYPGAMREVVEAETGAPCLFIQGALADLGPVNGFVDDVDVADRNGRQLAYAALETLTSLPPAGTKFEYAGPVDSGARIGTWSHVPLASDEQRLRAAWNWQRAEVPLALRDDLPPQEQLQAELAHWKSQEEVARNAADQQRVRDARAQAERRQRALRHLEGQSQMTHVRYPLTLWRMGDAIWLTVGGEPYNVLQRHLRQRFPGVPIIVATLAGGFSVGYLPPEDLYGKGIYQELIASVAPGSLEQIIEELEVRIKKMLDDI